MARQTPGRSPLEPLSIHIQNGPSQPPGLGIRARKELAALVRAVVVSYVPVLLLQTDSGLLQALVITPVFLPVQLCHLFPAELPVVSVQTCLDGTRLTSPQKVFPQTSLVLWFGPSTPTGKRRKRKSCCNAARNRAPSPRLQDPHADTTTLLSFARHPVTQQHHWPQTRHVGNRPGLFLLFPARSKLLSLSSLIKWLEPHTS
jgi:hypothetical protein